MKRETPNEDAITFQADAPKGVAQQFCLENICHKSYREFTKKILRRIGINVP